MFIDGILEDEKLFTDVTGYAFSANAVERALINKISIRAKPAATPVAETMGRRVEDLKAALFRMTV